MTRFDVATYRLQLHRDFTFADATQQLPYLVRLGISTVYLSPILQAAPGSTHGYDVVDHTRVNDELGGESGLRSFAEEAHRLGLAILVDVVPNHMALTAPEFLNPVVWELLLEGRKGTTAHWFDIDWAAGDDRVTLPLLSQRVADEIAAGHLRLGRRNAEPVVTYYDHVFPVASGTEMLELDDLLAAQHYRLAGWREASSVVNYRRFFAINSLIAIRVEDPEVFDASHRLLLRLHHEGVIDGFRIDHPDGLADPAGYLRRLRGAVQSDAPVYVEKILQGSEELPADWPVSGTTGYEAARRITHALASPLTSSALDLAWLETGATADLDAVIDESKRFVVSGMLAAETGRLARRAAEALGDEVQGLHDAVTELLVAGRLYRAYRGPASQPAPSYVDTITAAVDRAVAARPGLKRPSRALERLALSPVGDAANDFAIRLQQVWSAVLAKAVEDTAFYRWNRMIALNEVGGEPAGELGAIEELHRWAARRQRSWPDAMNALSTHDTKRSEDVRARILAVAADPEAWSGCSREFARAADDLGLDRPTAHLVWQTLIGAGEIAAERVDAALVKAVREASDHTTWADPIPAYEDAVLRLAELARAPGRLHTRLADALERAQPRIRSLVLAQKTLQLMLPGVPDLYQGSEALLLSLVDPDNRRSIDFGELGRLLDHHDADDDWTLAEEKLFITSRLLRLRREEPEAFGSHSRYVALPFIDDGRHPAAPYLGFVRGERVACIVTTAAHTGAWHTERVTLPDGMWRDVLTDQVFASTPTVLPCYQVFARFPVAVLVRES